MINIYVFLILFLLLGYIWIHYFYYSNNEGFIQDVSFLLKTNEYIYDDFYAEIYDTLYQPKDDIVFVTEFLVHNTIINNQSVCFVSDCETGDLTHSFQEYMPTFTIHTSTSMITYSLSKYPSLQVKVGDIERPMTYDNSTFSHIVCQGFGFYKVKEKKRLLRNFFHWLRPNGYLLLQLVNPSSFDTIVPAGRSMVLPTPQKFSKERITETEIHFGSFIYKNQYHFHDVDVSKSETFIDIATNHVRKNEQTLYMESIDELLSIILSCGFIVLKKTMLPHDKHQYLYLFTKSSDTIHYQNN